VTGPGFRAGQLRSRVGWSGGEATAKVCGVTVAMLSG
jgi:hypothetical protein